MDKKVSVLIGTYNRVNLISRTLDSILNQTYENIEIIVVDDCSSDKTKEVLESYAVQYPDRFKYIVNEKNMGISYNCNRAYEIATGDYFALIGDDDEWSDKDKITKQVKEFSEDNILGIVGTFWKDIKNGNIVREHTPKVDRNPLSQILKGNGVYCGSSVLISRDAWERIGGFDEKVPRGTDSDLFRSIIALGFRTKIIKSFSVNVYVDEHPRMTPQNTLSSRKKTLFSHSYTLYKFKTLYIKHPHSLTIRVYSILLALLSLAKFYIIGDKNDNN